MKKHYTQDELEKMRQLKREGATYEELATMFNRTAQGVQQKFSELGWSNGGNDSVVEAPGNCSLDKFQPRELIKYLYNLGYRIKDNKLVFVYEQVVNIKSVLED